VNFDVDVRVGTIESVLSGGEVTVLRAEDTIQLRVTVNPVTDMPTVTGSSTVDEDMSVNFGANVRSVRTTRRTARKRSRKSCWGTSGGRDGDVHGVWHP